MTKSDTGSELVFVYGTLRRGASNAHRMEGAEFVARGEVAGSLHRISWYPGLVLSLRGGRVTGDLFRVDAELLRKLDEYEGLPAGEVAGSEYRRVKTVVLDLDGSGRSWEAWVWEWIGPVEPGMLVKSGDWLDVERPRQPPWFTAIAGACLLAFPVCLMKADDPMVHRSMTDKLTAVSYGLAAALAPFAAMAAAYLAGRRRERYPRTGSVVFCVAILAGVFVILGVLASFVSGPPA